MSSTRLAVTTMTSIAAWTSAPTAAALPRPNLSASRPLPGASNSSTIQRTPSNAPDTVATPKTAPNTVTCSPKRWRSRSDRVPMMMPKVVNPWAKPATYVSSVWEVVASATDDDDPWLADAPGAVGNRPCRLGRASSGRVTDEAVCGSTAGTSEG